MKKLVYLTHMRLPTEKAYGVQMVNTVKAIAEGGLEVTLLGTNRKNKIKEDLFSYYGFSKDSFTYTEIPSIKLFQTKRFGFWINMLSFSFFAIVHILRNKFSIVYSREPFPVIFLSLLKLITIYEVHDHPKKHIWFHKIIFKRVTYVFVTNEHAYKTLVNDLGVPSSKVLLVPNGFDTKKFNVELDASEARKKLKLPLDKKIVLYAGHLYEWKGAHTLIDLAKKMPTVVFCIVGGTVEDQKKFIDLSRNITNLILIPHQKPERVPIYLKAADILVLPNLATNSHSEYSTSPIKLFEYMASMRVVIASDLPSIRSIVSDREVVFAKPGDSISWQEKINVCLNNDLYIKRLIDNARALVEQYSWQNRAMRIISFISNRQVCVE